MAQQHDLTTQNISYAINCLEEYIGDDVFDKKNDKTSLTESGKLLYEFSVKQIRAYHMIFFDGGRSISNIRIAFMKSLEEIFIPNLLIDSFKNKIAYKFQFSRLNDIDIKRLSEQIEAAELDIAVFWNIINKGCTENTLQTISNNIALKKLFIAVPYVWTSKDSDFAKLKVIRKANLYGEKFITNSGGNDNMAGKFTNFLDSEQIIFKSDQKNIIAKMVSENIAHYIDFMLPNQKLIQQQLFSGDNLIAVKLDINIVLECVALYRNKETIENALQLLDF